MKTRTLRIEGIDGLKGLAALSIAWIYHYIHFESYSPNGLPFQEVLQPVYTYGLTLVDLFFVLSGFIFSAIYFERVRNKSVNILDYSWKRISRLYPLHLITLLTVTVLLLLRWVLRYDSFMFDNNDVYHFVLNLFLLQYGSFEFGFSFNGPSWAIAVEVFAYLVFFFVSLFSKNKLHYYLGAFCLIGVGLFFAQSGFALPFLNWNIGRVLVGFFAGSLTEGVYSYIKSQSKIVTIIISCCAVFTLVLLSLGMSINLIGFLGHQWIYIMAMVYYPLLLLSVLLINPLRWLLTTPLFTFLGHISYSIYLWHYPIQMGIVTMNQYLDLGIDFATTKTFVSYGAVIILVSSTSYIVFEKPASNLLRNNYIKNQLKRLNKSWNS
jgi:peptidoglycan/LPS O-acetylase OafA/YrhL